jgi:rhodanese-related sulfurtransferase
MTSAPPPIRQLSASDLKALFEGGTPIELVDVRTYEERAIAAIEARDCSPSIRHQST